MTEAGSQNNRPAADAESQPADAPKAAPGLFRRIAAPFVRVARGGFGLVWSNGEAVIWWWALLIGVAGGYVALGFRLAIGSIQFATFGTFDAATATAMGFPVWGQILLVPTAGGIVVAGLLWIGKRTGALREQRAEGVADVIEARAIHKGSIQPGTAALSGLIAAVSLGAGASSGREGPAVHLGAAVGSVVSEGLGLTARQARTLLACGAAAGVAASFNAPIAGVLFALEVILGHYALRVVAPVSIASLAAAVVATLHLGPDAAFPVPALSAAQLGDFPAAAVLGFVCAVTAIVFMRLTLTGSARVAGLAKKIHLPLWALPPIGGVLIGGIAIVVPEVLGVGYEAVGSALAGDYQIGFLLALAAAKILATSLTLSFRFGGGVFSPAVVIGAALGAAFGGLVAATGLDSAGEGFFALIGMGAMAGAVLGAPISTTLIVFELTKSYEASAAMLVAVSIATVIVQSSMGGSYFQKQVEMHGWHIAAGPQRLLLQTVRVRDFMTPASEASAEKSAESAALYEDDSLGRALALLKAEDLDGAAVKRRGGDESVVGYVSRTDALVAYNNALVDAHAERSR